MQARCRNNLDYDASQAAKFIFTPGSDHKILTEEAENACKQAGVQKEALLLRSLESFFIVNDPVELAQVRAEHYAQRRQGKIKV